MQTIRKNATKRIAAILNASVLIREYRYDDMGDVAGSVEAARVLETMKTFDVDRVYENNGVLVVAIHRNWSFTAFASIEAARRTLTPLAFAKYFPQVAA